MKAAPVLVFVLAIMIFTASAFGAANAPTKSVYNLKATQVQSSVGGSTVTHPKPAATAAPSVSTTTQSGTLPFTGVDLGLYALAGVALVGVGIGLRRITNKHPL